MSIVYHLKIQLSNYKEIEYFHHSEVPTSMLIAEHIVVLQWNFVDE